jgi:hypothetical protein
LAAYTEKAGAKKITENQLLSLEASLRREKTLNHLVEQCTSELPEMLESIPAATEPQIE